MITGLKINFSVPWSCWAVSPCPQIIEQNLLHESTIVRALKLSYDLIGARFDPSQADIYVQKWNHLCQWRLKASVMNPICMSQVQKELRSAIDFITSCQQYVNLLFVVSAHRFVHHCGIMGNCQHYRHLDSGELSLPSTGASNKTSSVLEGKRVILLCFYYNILTTQPSVCD